MPQIRPAIRIAEMQSSPVIKRYFSVSAVLFSRSFKFGAKNKIFIFTGQLDRMKIWLLEIVFHKPPRATSLHNVLGILMARTNGKNLHAQRCSAHTTNSCTEIPGGQNDII